MDITTVALYMRLSREDDKAIENGLVKDESNSISNQRKLLLGFLKRKPELADSPIVQYVDDGYSGTGFERPGFVEMMDEVKKGKIQCVIVKDFSRFGRDYIELGDYIEHIFPFMQVRFIAVNDGYDSNEYKGKTPDIDVPFRNLAYSLYSQDISDKIKSSLAVRRKKGLYVGSIPLYGYQRDEKGFLTPDEETKGTVQRIYREYLSGKGLAELARELNGEGIPSPKQHKINKGLLRGEKEKSFEGKTCFWIPTTIHQILRNETYTGVLSSSAYKRGTLGSGKRVFVPENERVRVENAHPAIIDKDIFRQVQEKMKKKKHCQAQQFLLKGLVRCGECGRLMVRDKKLFRCRYQQFTEHRNVESIPEAELEGIVWKAVDMLLQLLDEREAVFQREKELCEEKRKKLLPEIKKKRMQAEKKREEIKQLYHQYRQGRMGKAEYLAKKRWEGDFAKEMEIELAGLEAEEEGLRQRIEEIDTDNVSIVECPGCREDKQKVLQCLIESVNVCEHKRINIIWLFHDKSEITFVSLP
ncbi:MAG: recombinase family protein [Lachnospiraceae bacterium]|nr:recombinase family protein [Lachnospiraceae bacterium]